MARITQSLRNAATHGVTRWIALPVLFAAGLAAVVAQSVDVLPPTISLSPEPLYARGARAKPTLTLALSVEFPTVGAQYVNTPQATDDPSYLSTTKYVGYFDTESCYLYNKSDADASLRYFYRTGAATDRGCGGTGFSGNFMNWATSSAIDVLRLGLTGGDRVVDTASLTVLQRAVLPSASDNNPGNFWNGSNFPSKQLTAAQAASAVPSSLLPSGFTGTLYVANCLNRMHFGTQKTGNCASPGNNGNLGVVSKAVGTPSAITTSLPGSGWSNCANENQTCSFTGIKEVAYGTNSNSGGWITVPASNGIVCGNNMTGSFLDPKPGVAKQCQIRDYTGAWTPPSSSDVLSADAFFYTRVRVCESDNSGTLTDPRTNLCLRYPNGNYKPVGNLQKYSDRVRVAAFGYLNDNTANPQRSGGVLRAPMKYVGSRTFDANFQLVSGTNSAQEWNESTGIFNTNPDGATAPNSGTGSNSPGNPISGVINYLNQFGRTGVFGQYKRYDAVGELYYESLRYLQGLQPSALGTSIATNVLYGINDTMRDGFPVYETYTDPHPAVSGMTDYSCVKNNIVGIGDVNTHNDKNFPGNTRTGKGDVARTASDAANEPDFRFWTKIVGDFEANRATTYVDGKGVTRTTSNPNTAVTTALLEDVNIGADGATYYMAGAAYWANTHDIRGTQWTETAKQRPGMRVTTYWLDVNEYGQQTAAATHRQNQFYLTAKYGGFKDVTTSGNPYLKLQANKVPADNLFETDPNNLNWERQTTDTNLKEAKNYFLSSSAQTVLDALDEIFATVASEANSIAGGAISTTRITTSGGLVYQAQFDPADWSGDVIAYPVALNASGNALNIAGSASSPWRNAADQPVGAAGKLDDMAPGDRNIYVGSNSTDATPVFETSVFTWAAAASSVKTALYNSSTEAESLGEDRLNFLRGDRTKEAGNTGGTFRKRSSKLGDVVNSGIAYVAAPTQRISDDSYASFYTTNLGRTKTLYVGANDGMLHAFNAETGAELFAYIPSFVVPNLKALTSTTYAHQSYVDGTPAAAEANLGDSSDADWRTVLVSGAGGGGQGVFALDVTDPDAFDDGDGNSKILWEFTDKHDVDMGNVIGRPQIVKINVDAGGTTPNYQYFAVIASGVNNQAADGNASTTGQPALFFLQLNKAKTAAWALGTNYYKVKFPVNDTSIASGMANFATRIGFANELSYIYAGDLQGNLWKLDFRTTSASDWDLNALSFYKNGSTAIPMFVAKDGTVAQNRQPITMEPTLSFGPNRSIIVSFGTGQYLSVADNSGPFKAQSVYALYDNNSNVNDTSSSPAAAIAGRGRLQAGTTTASTVTVSAFTWGRPTSDTSTASRSGWYFDFYNSATTTSPAFAGTGERQISGSEVLAGRMVFGTVIPALNSCDNGTGNLYVIDLQSGNGTSTVSTVGILGEPFVATLGSSAITVSNSTGTRKETVRNQIITQGSGGLGTQPSVLTNQSVGRLSWREISNYHDVRNAP